MTNQEFINKCKWRVSDYLNKLVGKETACKPENVFVVWQAKALQNHKAMLAAPGRYNDKDYYDIKTSIDYKVEELLEGERDGKQGS